MNYRNSSLTFMIASSLGAVPATYAVDLGTYNDTSFSVAGFLKAEGIFEDPENGDSRIFGRANQSRFNLKTVTQKQGHTVIGFRGDFYGASIRARTATGVCATLLSRLITPLLVRLGPASSGLWPSPTTSTSWVAHVAPWPV